MAVLMRVGSARPTQGFTLLAVTATVALVSLALAAAGPLWSEQRRRDRELELLQLGVLYAQALQSYRDASPGSEQQYPARLEDLMLDTRFVGTRRHLRRPYPDPMSRARPWGLVTDARGRIQGVFSRSEAPPIAQGPVILDDRVLPAALRYIDWQFIALSTP